MKNRLKEFRARFNLTQENLAGLIEVSRQTINAIENSRFNPSLDIAFELAEVFEVSVDELFIHKELDEEDIKEIQEELSLHKQGYL